MADAAAFEHRLAFLAVVIVGTLYFLLRRRMFDFSSVAFFAGCFYFLPGLVGFVGYPREFLLTPTPLEPTTYAVMTWVLGCSVVFGIISDQFPHKAIPPAHRDPADPLRFTGLVATCASATGLLLAWITMGDLLWDADKVLVVDGLNRWYLLWTSGAVIGFCIAHARGAHTLVAANLALLLLNLYVGFRVDLVIAVIAAITITLGRKGDARLGSRWRLGLLLGFFGVSLFAYKYLLFAIKSLDIDLLVAQARNPDILSLMFLYSEPFVIQGTLNEVIRQDYTLAADHLQSALMLFVPFANNLGAEFAGFNDFFQPTLFSSVTGYGLGSNIWAEMMAVGGWPAIIGLSVVIGVSLIAASRACLSSRPELVALITVVAVYWAFYVHRNDLLYQLTLTRRILLAWLTFILIAIALAELARRIDLIASTIRRSPG